MQEINLAAINERKRDMSFNCIYSNIKNVYIGADSRECFSDGHYNDKYQKVFYNRSLKLIWSMTGVIKYNHIDYFSLINGIMNNKEANINEKVDSIQLLINPITKSCYQKTSQDSYFDMFIATLRDDRIVCYTIESKNGMNPELSNQVNWGLYQEVSGVHLEHHLHLTDEELVTLYPCQMIKRIYQSISHAIESSSYDKVQTIGGDVYSVFMNDKGDIKTYINGEEAFF